MGNVDQLDLAGIDALLDRFKKRRKDQDRMRKTLADFEVDAPQIVSAQAMTAMEQRFRMVADHAAGDMGAGLRSQVDFELASCRQLRLRSVVEGLPNRLCIARSEAPGLPLPVFVLMDLETATSIIDRLVGGQGASSDVDRDFTPIEQRVLMDVIRPFLSSHEKVLSSTLPLSLQEPVFQSTRDELAAFPLPELFLVVAYDVTVAGSVNWRFQLLLPLANLVDAIEKAATVPLQLSELAEERREALKQRLMGVGVGCSVDIGSSELTLSDVAGLVPGDVVLLDKKPGELFELRIEGALKYRGRLGRRGQGMAFEVAEAVNAEAS